MPTINGRLICCGCGADLGDAADPFRDPDCAACLDAELDAERDDAEREAAELDADDLLAVEVGAAIRAGFAKGGA